jgi:hypothetical protein
MIGTAELAVDKHVGYRYAHVCGILRVLPWRPQRPWTANPRHSWISGQLLTHKIYFAAIFVGWPLATTHPACKPSSYDPVLGPLAPWGPFAHHSDPTIRRPRQEHLHFNSLVRGIASGNTSWEVLRPKPAERYCVRQLLAELATRR